MQYSFILYSMKNTKQFGQFLAENVLAGDTVLLSGEVGAGKTALASACIQAQLSEIGVLEDVPSPTFTLVQVYELIDTEIWHADLYRLASFDEVYELGLDQAFDKNICFIEWPNLLGSLRPERALSVQLDTIDDNRRRVSLEWSDHKWDSMITQLEYLSFASE